MGKMRSLTNIGGIVPTVFDIPGIWRLNAQRAGGWYNLLFGWWMTLLFAPALVPITIICLVEWALMSQDQRKEHRKLWPED